MTRVTDKPLVQQVEELLSGNRPAEALRLLERRAESSADPYLLLLRGDALRRLGRFPAAIRLLREARRAGRELQAPWYARGCWCLGLALRAVGRFPEAAGAFLDGLEASPSDPLVVHSLQFTRLEDGQIADLLPRLSAVAECVPDLPVPQQLLAEWERRCGQEESALIRSHRAARLGTPAHQRQWLDVAALPSAPEAIIIGAPKCGTTSLMGCLNLHSQIWAHPRKELHFFDTRWPWGKAWYFCQFPVFQSGSGIVRLEATPNYLQLPEVPERVRAIAPDARLIVLLRDPVQRALSWLQHMRRQEGLQDDPVQALKQELQDLEAMPTAELEAMGWRHPNALAGSLYHIHLARWQACFSSEQMLVLCLEDLIEDPVSSLERVYGFLGLPACAAPGIQQLPLFNAAPAPYPGLPDGIRQRLLTGLLAAPREVWNSYRGGPEAAGD